MSLRIYIYLLQQKIIFLPSHLVINALIARLVDIPWNKKRRKKSYSFLPLSPSSFSSPFSLFLFLPLSSHSQSFLKFTLLPPTSLLFLLNSPISFIPISPSLPLPSPSPLFHFPFPISISLSPSHPFLSPSPAPFLLNPGKSLNYKCA